MWANRINKNHVFTLAPDWYVQAKAEGVSEEKLFVMVKDFCREVLAKDAKENGKEAEEPDDSLVELMITTYEA